MNKIVLAGVLGVILSYTTVLNADVSLTDRQKLKKQRMIEKQEANEKLAKAKKERIALKEERKQQKLQRVKLKELRKAQSLEAKQYREKQKASRGR